MADSLIPRFLVPVVRDAFRRAGINPAAVLESGDLDFSRLAASTYNKVEVWSRVTPTFTMAVDEILASGPPNPWLAFLQPTIILSGPAGRQVIAPYGVAERGTVANWSAPMVLGLLLVATVAFIRKV